MARKKGPSRPRKGAADQGIDPRQFPDLNRTFYGSVGPHDYLLHRLRAAVLASREPDELPDSLDRPFFVNKLRIEWPSEGVTDESEHRAAFLTAESVVVLHHAAEALIRLFVGHRGRPPCPWLEVATWRFEYKSRLVALRKEFAASDIATELMDVFYGSPEHGEGVGLSADEWAECQKGVTRLARTCLQLLLDEGAMYNATKHGLAVRPATESSMAFGSDPGNPLLSQQGPTLTYLEQTERPDRYVWQQTTTWVRAEQNLSLTFLVCRMLYNLWQVATARYCGADSVKLHRLSEEAVDVAARALPEDRKTFEVPSMSMELAYRVPGPR